MLLGFEQLERLLESGASRGSDGFPPFNIERFGAEDGQDRYRVTLAVAGFPREQLDITIEEGRRLIVRGAPTETETGEFLHRGIAARAFQRSFLLADGVDVAAARLADGLLVIELTRTPRDIVSHQIPVRRA